MASVPTPHLVIPFAACSAGDWLETMQALPAESLKNLASLLRGMQLLASEAGDAHALSTPHERVLARAQGLAAQPLDDGLIPWAAQQAANTLGEGDRRLAWAFITPCHWAMGRQHATLSDPAALALTPDESRALLSAMQPYFETEGITLHYAAPGRWLAEGEIFRHLPTASLDRVLGRNVDAWLPQARPSPVAGDALQGQKYAAAKTLRRLQNEMQMLLYTHALNDERSAKRLLTVNSLWISGTGALSNAPAAPSEQLSAPRTLAQAAFTDDWQAYALAWQALDADHMAELLARQNDGQTVRLTLCGECHAQTFETAKAGPWSAVKRQINHLLAPQRTLAVLKQL